MTQRLLLASLLLLAILAAPPAMQALSFSTSESSQPAMGQEGPNSSSPQLQGPTGAFNQKFLAGFGKSDPACLAPTAADTASTNIQPASTNASLSGHVIQDILTGKAGYNGSLPPTQTIQMELVFAIRNQPQFEACLASIEDPQSPNHEHFLDSNTLSPYLPTPGQKASIVSYFTQRGFSVSNGPSPLVLDMTADVKHIEGGLGVKMNQYSSEGSNFYGVDVDPKLPTNFLTIVGGIMGLNNYVKISPAETPCGPPFPYCSKGIQTGYSLPPLYASGYDGTGQKVAIVDEPGDPNMQSAIDTFDSQYGLKATTLDIRLLDSCCSTYDPGWATETAMDVEAVHTVAPGAGIVLLYDSVDLMNAVDYVATNHLATIVTNSWAYTCTGSLTWCSDTQLNQQYPGLISNVDARLSFDTARGLTILFASGDKGAKPDGSTLGTEFPASDPNVLAVGGTDLILTGCGNSSCSGYGSESGASVSGGGYSGYFAEPSWQVSTIGDRSGSCPGAVCRAVPDVSMIGGNDAVGGVGFWVYSTRSDLCTLDDTNHGAGWFGCTGTSLSTPLWAGFLAVALQVRGGASFGNIDPLLYQLANSGSYSSIFHDITSGSNGYPAGTGWDPVTGWGSPISNSLTNYLAPQITFDTNPAPAGSISWDSCSNPGYTNGQTLQSNNLGVHTICANTLTNAPFAGWSCTGSISCSGLNPISTATFNGPGTITANFGFPPLSFDFRLSNSGSSLNLGGVTVPRGSSGSVTITIALVNAPAQTVTLSCSQANGSPLPSGVSCSPASGTPPFTTTLTITVASSTAPGYYTIKVIGTAGSLTRSTWFTLNVT